jgi:hypothetical protein
MVLLQGISSTDVSELGDEAAGSGAVTRAWFVVGRLHEISAGLVQRNSLLYQPSVGRLAR